MSDKVPAPKGEGGSVSIGLAAILLIGLGGASLVRMGYEFGINQSKKILKRHDKDTRRMYKREKQMYKEQRKREKEREKKQAP